MKILDKNNFALWWRFVRIWLAKQFAAISSSIDFTPVNNKLDTVSGKVDTVGGKVDTAISKIDNIPAPDMSAIAKQGSNAAATNTAILTAIGNVNVESADQVASFFNITEATEYTALTPAEAIAIARDCQYNVMGTDWPIPTWLPTGVTEAQVESAAEGLGIPYHEPTQTA